MKNYPVRRTFISIDRWVGLIAGLVLVVIGLTGSVSVYWRELHMYGVYESPLYVAIDPYAAKVTYYYYWGETPAGYTTCTRTCRRARAA